MKWVPILYYYISNFYFQTIFSSGKSLEAIAMATLFDKGLFQYEDTIGKYWPEFAQNGKENVKICDVLRHESGLAYFKGQAHDVFSQILNECGPKIFFYQLLYK